jgi:hypothetical protein
MNDFMKKISRAFLGSAASRREILSVSAYYCHGGSSGAREQVVVRFHRLRKCNLASDQTHRANPKINHPKHLNEI